MSSSPKRYNISYGNKARNYQPLIFKILSVLVFGLIVLTLFVGIFASGDPIPELVIRTTDSNATILHTKSPIPHYPIIMEGPCEPQPSPTHCQSTDDSETVYFCTFRHKFGKVYVCIGDLRRWEEVVY